MKKIKKYFIIVIALFLIIRADNIFAQSGEVGTGSGGSGANSGDVSSLSVYDLVNSIGIKISVLKKDGNGYKTIATKNYLQSGFTASASQTSPSGKSKYDVIKDGVSWSSSAISGVTYGSLNNGNIASELTTLQHLLGSNDDNYKTAVENLKDYLTSSGNVTLKGYGSYGSRTIQGMGMDEDVFDEFKCSGDQIFVFLEPMLGYGVRDSAGNVTQYWGTATEIASLGKDSPQRPLTTMASWAYTDETTTTVDQGSAMDGTIIRWPFVKATGTATHAKLYTKNTANPTSQEGWGLRIVWAGTLGIYCTPCYDPSAVSTKMPACREDGASITIREKFKQNNSNGCFRKETLERQKIQEYGRQVKIVTKKNNRDPENNCSIYCKESITLNFPGKLKDTIDFGTDLADKNITWPDSDQYKMTVVGKKTCRFKINGKLNDTKIKNCNINITQNIANEIYSDFNVGLTLDYNDKKYGETINLGSKLVEGPTCTGRCTKLNSRQFTQRKLEKRKFQITIVKEVYLPKETSYSLFNRKTSRYELYDVSKEQNKNYRVFSKGSLAISHESTNKQNFSASDNRRNGIFKSNIQLQTLSSLVNDGKLLGSNNSLGKYSCEYNVSVGTTTSSCDKCRDANNPDVFYNLCCLGDNDAEIMDRYCPNGILDESSLGQDILNKVKDGTACTCNGEDEYSGNTYDITDCMKNNYQSKGGYNGARDYCIKNDPIAMKYCCPDCPIILICGEGPTEEIKKKRLNVEEVEKYGLSQVREWYCQACPDGTKNDEMSECLKKGYSRNVCIAELCDNDSKFCINASGRKVNLRSCINSGVDEEICVQQLCPDSTFTCNQIARDVGKTVPAAARNVDVTKCMNELKASGETVNKRKKECIKRYCNVCPTDSKFHKGEVITEDLIIKYGSIANVEKYWCNCPNCAKVYFCPSGLNITSCVEKKMASGMEESDSKTECKKQLCNQSPYLYRTINLSEPFSTTTFNASSATARTPGENWGNDSKENTSSLIYKYIIKGSDTLYSSGTPQYVIDLDPNVINFAKSHNNNNEYGDFKLDCDKDGNYCISEFLQSLSGGISGQCFSRGGTARNTLKQCMKN